MDSRKKDYAYFNAALDRLMSSGGFYEPSTTTAAISEGKAEPASGGGTGSLIVQVTMANGAVPIPGATVTISESDGEVKTVQTTDISGRTPGFELSTPSLALSQSPGGAAPYTTYNIRIEKPGFYTREFLNVAVFPGIVSIQGVALEPLGEDAFEDDRINGSSTQGGR